MTYAARWTVINFLLCHRHNFSQRRYSDLRKPSIIFVILINGLSQFCKTFKEFLTASGLRQHCVPLVSIVTSEDAALKFFCANYGFQRYLVSDDFVFENKFICILETAGILGSNVLFKIYLMDIIS
ncbi:hypothetical protein CDAR_505971 [Caerostris darwini]|uniref:Uncharacterized protein n=1 Tax=Caerostris darwini TaxID=1538125 RepID=A0AAV4WKL6_9ARAC|nr:hypothetical protein CDAR_505971 [Caerostris darwini]